MSLLDKASLIVTPNGYKESKLYSVVPTSGAGDMNVVRATTATRVNSAGLIEVVPRNLAQYSEDFNNGYWGKFNTTITVNNTTAPNGTATADKFVENTANNFHSMDSTFTTGTGIHTASIYAKIGERRYLRLNITEITPAVDHTALFDLQTGILLSSGSGVTATIEAITNGWYRIRVTSPALVGGQVRMVVLMQTTTSVTPQSYLGNGTSGLFIWGAQLEQGSTVTEYFPTTTRLNIPRIDYTNGSCPSLLVEPQRTNLLTYSNDFTNAIWTKDNVTLTSGITSPSGVNNAFKLVESATTSTHSIYQTFITLPSSVYSTSIYVKKGERFKVAVADRNTGIYVAFNLNTGTIIASNSLIGKIELLNNDWYRLTVTTSSAISVYVPQFFILEDGYTTGVPILQPYLGNVVKGVFISFSQMESGAYPTSYMPTVASSVTRNADVISKTGISSLIGQTEGTVFLEYFNKNGLANIPFKVVGSDGKLIWIRGTGAMFYGNSSALLFNNFGTPTANQKYKIAFVYGQNDFRLYVNGSLISSVTSGTFTGSFNDIQLPALPNETPFGDQFFVNSLQLYKTKLSNTELAQLTTL